MIFFLILLLTLLTARTMMTGRAMWRQESAALAASKASLAPDSGGGGEDAAGGGGSCSGNSGGSTGAKMAAEAAVEAGEGDSEQRAVGGVSRRVRAASSSRRQLVARQPSMLVRILQAPVVLDGVPEDVLMPELDAPRAMPVAIGDQLRAATQRAGLAIAAALPAEAARPTVHPRRWYTISGRMRVPPAEEQRQQLAGGHGGGSSRGGGEACDVSAGAPRTTDSKLEAGGDAPEKQERSPCAALSVEAQASAMEGGGQGGSWHTSLSCVTRAPPACLAITSGTPPRSLPAVGNACDAGAMALGVAAARPVAGV